MPQQWDVYDIAHSAFPHIYGDSVAEYFTECKSFIIKEFYSLLCQPETIYT